MNRYYDAMEHCAPGEGLRERLEENVLSARPERAKTYRPRRKKTALVLLAAVLLLATSAATIWDPLFVRRFGPNAALSALGGAVFQEVNVTSHRPCAATRPSTIFWSTACPRASPWRRGSI